MRANRKNQRNEDAYFHKFRLPGPKPSNAAPKELRFGAFGRTIRDALELLNCNPDALRRYVGDIITIHSVICLHVEYQIITTLRHNLE